MRIFLQAIFCILVLTLSSVAAPTGNDWMASIGGAARLSQISIPGTHDSGALFEPFPGTAKCQNATIAEQLAFGVRFLDIRCKHVNDAFDIYHGTVNQNLTFTQVLDQVTGFLNTNPGECVMMSIKEEDASSGATRSFEATFDSYVALNPAKWALGTSVPTLSAVRGKIQLFRRFGATVAKGINATNWPDNTTFNVNNLRVQDQYQVPDNAVKWNAITTGFTAAFAETNANILHLNFTSGYKPGFLGIPSITTVSDAINPQLATYFGTAARGYYGCVLMDFADATRTALIYNTNFIAPVFTTNPLTRAAALKNTSYAATLAGSATDANPGDTLSYSKIGSPAWLNIAANGTLSGTPGNSDLGPNTFTIRVTDDAGLFAEATLNITVVPDAQTWTGGTSDWGTIGNWNPSGIPAGNATFTSTGNTSVYLGTAPRTVGSITFDTTTTATPYTIFLRESAGVATSRRLTVGNMTVNAGNHTILGNGTASELSVGNGSTISVATNSTLNFNAKLGGISALIKSGDGTLVFQRSNGGSNAWQTGASGFTVSAGTLEMAASGASGHSSNNFIVSSGATLKLSASGAMGSALLTLNGTGMSGVGALYATTITTVTTPSVVLNSNSRIGVDPGQTLTISSLISGAGLEKSGNGTLTLTAANAYTGTTAINEGTLAFTTSNTLPGGLTFGTTVGSTTVSALDLSAVSATFAGAFRVQTNSSANNTISIGAGKTLTVTNGATIGFNSAANTVTKLTTTGLGEFSITGGNFQLGGSVTSSLGNAATLDMSGLDKFTYNFSTGTFRVGDATNSAGGGTGSSTLILADTSAITALLFTMNSPTGAAQAVRLGSVANTINADNINIGATTQRSPGTLNFNGATGTLTVRAIDTAGRANMTVAYGAQTTGVVNTSSVDLTGHSSDLLLGNLQIAGRTGGTGAATTGTFSFDTGTLDATGVTVGVRAGTSATSTGLVTGTLNLGGSNVDIGASGLSVGINTASLAANTLNATVNISGSGTVDIGATSGTSITLGSSTDAGAGATTALLNITGGTTTLTGDIVKGSTVGTLNSILKLAGGSLDMGGNDIGAAGAGAITLTAEFGELKNVASINGTGGLTKTTAGTLVLSGTNSYTGDTTVSGGVLAVTGNSIADTNKLIIAGGKVNLTGTETVNRLFFGGVQQPAGNYTSADPSLNFTGNGTLTVATGPGGFSTWIAGAFTNGTVPLDKRGPNDDFDNDGILNLLEYAIAGEDPTVPDPTVGSLTANTLSFSKRLEATGITYAIQKSTDLGISVPWAVVDSYLENSASTISFTLNPPTPVKNFLRLQVTQN